MNQCQFAGAGQELAVLEPTVVRRLAADGLGRVMQGQRLSGPPGGPKHVTEPTEWLVGDVAEETAENALDVEIEYTVQMGESLQRWQNVAALDAGKVASADTDGIGQRFWCEIGVDARTREHAADLG